MEFHEYANLFPMMNSVEFEELCKGMARNGYYSENPITIYQGKILDGRNRFKAATQVGVTPVFSEYKGDDPLGFVLSQNLHRRHLNESQRAVIAAKLANMERGEFHGNQYVVSANLQIPKVSQLQASQLLGVSPRTVATIKAIEKDAPELIARIESGEMTAHEAHKKTKSAVREGLKKSAELNMDTESVNGLSNLILGDMREVCEGMPENSVDLILTDPPYPGEFIECWSWLSKAALKVLKPSGFLFAYSGQLHLPEVYARLSENLNYYWTINLSHSGNKQLIMPRNVFCGWKPILVYQKPPFKRFEEKFEDVIVGSGREKDHHDWQQGEGELASIISKFTMAGDVVLDPFAGGGTTLVACSKMKRRSIGIEIDENTYLSARKRILDAV